MLTVSLLLHIWLLTFVMFFRSLLFSKMSTSTFIAIVVAIIGVLYLLGVHEVEEGHVGVYWFGGRLVDKITIPGFHLSIPGESFRQIQTTMQTDQVRDIPCGTSGGVVLYFDKIEVVNRLKEEYVLETIRNYTIHYDRTWIYDKIHHAINEFCSVHTLQEVYIDLFDQLDESLRLALIRNLDVWAPGIEIIAIRVTKPRIPESIRQNYEQVETEKTKLLIATQKQHVVVKEAQTEKSKAIIGAQKALAVANIENENIIAQKENEQKMALIEDKVHLAREHAFADNAFYKAAKEAEANEQLLSKEYLAFERMQALTENTNIWFGNKIPNSLRMNDVNGQ